MGQIVRMDSQEITRRTFLAALIASQLPGRSCQANMSGQWIDSHQQGRYQIVSEFSLKSLRTVTEDLQRLENHLATYLQLSIPQAPIEIYLYKNSRNFSAAAKAVSSNMRNRRALYVQSGEKKQVLVYSSSSLMTDLRHETTHALMHCAVPYLPLWLDEGLAELFEVVLKSGQAHPHLASLKWSSRWRWKPNLQQLGNLTEEAKMTAAHYRDSCAVTHYLVHGDVEAHQVMVDYLKTAQQGDWNGTLVEKLLKIPRIESKILNHVRRNC